MPCARHCAQQLAPKIGLVKEVQALQWSLQSCMRLRLQQAGLGTVPLYLASHCLCTAAARLTGNDAVERRVCLKAQSGVDKLAA